jgi:succinyl-diaminopimelate desuccinylase
VHQERILDHLKNLVSFYPKSQSQGAVLRALNYCKDALTSAGSFSDAKLHHHEGFYSLTASTQSTKQPKLLLEAHIDVVPTSRAPVLKHDPDTRTLTGRGVYDMLFATACYLAFIEEHQADLPQLDMGLMITGDEELGGFQGVEYLLGQGYGCEVCFLPDAGNGFGDLSTSAKGVYNFDLVARGRAHHGSRPWEGDGAANKLVHMLHQLLHAFDDSDHDNSTMTVTGLKCGQATNQAPSQATAHLDIRYKDAADYQRIKKLVARLCAEFDAETKNVMTADNLALDTDNLHLQDFIKLYEKHTAHPITLSKAHGGSDARFFAAKGIPVIMLRPDGSGAHADEETLFLESLLRFYLLLEEYVVKTAKK